MHVTPLVLCLEDGHGLLHGNRPGLAGVVLQDETGKRFADDQADVQGLAGTPARGPAGALQDRDVVRMAQDQVGSRSGRFTSLPTLISLVASRVETTLPW